MFRVSPMWSVKSGEPFNENNGRDHSIVSIDDTRAEFVSYIVLSCNYAKTSFGCTLPRLGDLTRYGRCEMFQLDFDCVNLTHLNMDFEAHLRTTDNYLRVESTNSEHKTSCVANDTWLTCNHTQTMLDFIAPVVRVAYSCCWTNFIVSLFFYMRRIMIIRLLGYWTIELLGFWELV